MRVGGHGYGRYPDRTRHNRPVPRRPLILLAVLSLAGCGGSKRAAVQPASVPPPPDQPVPHGPAALSTALSTTTVHLEQAIGAWMATDRQASTAPPEPVVLYALYQQRIYRLLATRPRLAADVQARLPDAVALQARDTVRALRDLGRLSSGPRPRHAIRTGAPLPAGVLERYYRLGERRFHVGWHVLAAVNFVETAFNRLRNRSASGAQGPMQFIPATWRRYGMGGDVHDPHDAILGAANLLHAAGAPGDYRRALYAYNPSPLYVDAVLRYARRIRRDRRAWLAYYSWQVFVRTSGGERRVTGPPPLGP